MSKINFFFAVILVTFVCQGVHSQTVNQSLSRACEGYNITLACPPEYLVNVNWANYGRILPGWLACPKLGYDLYTGCISTNTTEILRRSCNGNDNCTITASSSTFGDPCYDVYKYLTATYSCVPYKRACEGYTMTITCPAGQSIMVINANFGRKLPGTQVCQYSDPSATTNTNCSAVNSTQIVSSSCNFKNNCSVQATNGNFGGDPCPGTYKYLQATYICV